MTPGYSPACTRTAGTATGGRRAQAGWAVTRSTEPSTTRNSATRCCRSPRSTGHWKPSGRRCWRSRRSLAAKHLPAYLSGAEWWGQSFSEPESGSDLATLRTRAVDDGGGGFIVNGQKIWTSQGPTATRLLVLVRTGASESRHRGLSMIMVDADAPGVSIRPIALASGRRELAEVFFDDVRVPRERLVGELNGGWAVAMHLMQYERGMYGYAVLTKVLAELGRLREHMVIRGATQAQRERFARVYVDVIAALARTATTVRKLADGVPVGRRQQRGQAAVRPRREGGQRPDPRRDKGSDDCRWRRPTGRRPNWTPPARSGGIRAPRRSWAAPPRCSAASSPTTFSGCPRREPRRRCGER